MQKTIAGIATPPGNSGIGIVRLSGPKALEISRLRLKPRIATTVKVLGDTAVAIYFKAPNSFTGEDIVELQCHGGHFLLQKVLATAVSHGAVLAEPGEFSRRAFLNGKISLDQAEAIIDIINAESELQLQCANKTFSGALRERLGQIESELIEISAKIEAALDYPDEVGSPDISLESVKKEIDGLINTAATGRIISHGINVAVLGKPNAGKSSIFNALLNNQRSIVTEIAGTTTDTISESINYRGIKIIFHDTAGIRKGSNKIEILGIERTKKVIESCDIALVIFDITEKPDGELLRLIGNKPHVAVYNKSDLEEFPSKIRGVAAKRLTGCLKVSALKNQNINEIKEQIYKKALFTPPAADSIIITNARHLNELKQASAALSRIDDAAPLDCIASEITTALNHIGNITGTRASEAVLDEIFSRFCLGK